VSDPLSMLVIFTLFLAFVVWRATAWTRRGKYPVAVAMWFVAAVILYEIALIVMRLAGGPGAGGAA